MIEFNQIINNLIVDIKEMPKLVQKMIRDENDPSINDMMKDNRRFIHLPFINNALLKSIPKNSYINIHDLIDSLSPKLRKLFITNLPDNCIGPIVLNINGKRVYVYE